MKSRFIALFIFLISLNANSYVPLFLAQEHLNELPEKLIVQINSVTSEALPEKDEEIMYFYQITLHTEVKFVGETNSKLHEGDSISICYKTSKTKHGLRPLCGYMPIKVPGKQDLCIVYLKNKADTNYTVDTYWALQVINDEFIKTILSDNHPNPKLDKTPLWVKEGIKNLQNISTPDNTNNSNDTSSF